MIDPTRFFRANRNFIVNFFSITEITAYSSSRLKINLKGCNDEFSILVSRERVNGFKKWMDR